VILDIHTPDFTTATRMAQAIDKTLGTGTATALDATSVKVHAPADASQRVAFVAMLEDMQVQPGDAPARVIVNSRTGTVVISSQVRIMPAAVSHGSLTVTISENPQVSQPNALSLGQTAVVPNSNIRVEQQQNHMFLFPPGVDLNEIVHAVNEVGAAPGDLVAILEALKEAGSLRAELIVI
jgi:flagellar P-ring protein precursor FlgI